MHPADATRFDATGFLLTAAALGMLIYGLSLVAAGREDMPGRRSSSLLGLACGFAAVRHARRHPSPLLDLAAAAVPTFAFSTITAGFAARVAISMTPFLLPLMFQIGFGASAFEAGLMVLVYMVGNLAMKSVTTPLLHRFGFRDVIRVNGTLCVVSLVACALLTPAAPVPVVYGVLLLAGMTRSMNFTAMSTLAFADVPGGLRASATTLSAMTQQAASALGVAAAAVVLSVFQALRADTVLVQGDFRNALFVRGRTDGRRRAGVAAPPRRCGRGTGAAIARIVLAPNRAVAPIVELGIGRRRKPGQRIGMHSVRSTLPFRFFARVRQRGRIPAFPTRLAPAQHARVEIDRAVLAHDLARTVGPGFVDLDRHEGAAPAQAFREVTGVVLGDARIGQRPDQAPGHRAGPRGGQRCHQRSRGNHRTYARDRQRHQARSQPRGTADHPARQGAGGSGMIDHGGDGVVVHGIAVREAARDDADVTGHEAVVHQLAGGPLGGAIVVERSDDCLDHGIPRSECELRRR